VGAGNYSLHRRVQNGFGAHPASYAVGLGVKRPGREAYHSHPYSAKIKECVELYLHSPVRLLACTVKKAEGQLYLFLLPSTWSFCSFVSSVGCVFEWDKLWWFR